MKENGAGFLTVVELVIAVILAAGGQDDALKAVGKHGPVGDEIEKALQTALGDDMAITFARRLPINDVASVRRGNVSVFPACPAIDDFCRCSAVE
jgi:hypothetical protein